MKQTEREQAVGRVLDNLSSFRALRVHQLCAQTFHRDVSLGQLHLLATLDELGPLTVSALAHHFSVSLPSASSLLDRLADREMVARTRSEVDRRVVSVEITDRGREAVQEFVGMKREEMLRLTALMTNQELNQFVAGMEAFTAAARRSAKHDSEAADTGTSQAAS